MSKKIESIIRRLENHNQKIVIIGHYNPDGDSLGSSLALNIALEKKGFTVTTIVPNEPAPFLKYLPGIERVIIFEELHQVSVQHALDTADIIFCIDFSVIDRCDQIAPLIAKSNAYKIVIDHHSCSEKFTDLEWIDISAPASSVLVYRLLKEFSPELIVNEVSTCLFTGILTDTGNFYHSNTTPESLHIAGKLLGSGVEIEKVRENLSEKKSVRQTRFFAYMYLKRLKVIEKYQAAYLLLSHKDYLRLKLKTGDTLGLVNSILMIKGIVFGVLLVEKENKILLSLRSKGEIPVNNFASEYFNGGGHFNASGGHLECSFNEAEEILIDMIEKELPKYLTSKKEELKNY